MCKKVLDIFSNCVTVPVLLKKFNTFSLRNITEASQIRKIIFILTVLSEHFYVKNSIIKT